MLFILNLLTLVLLQICLVSNLLLRVEVTQVQSLTPISFIIHTVIIILIYIVLVRVVIPSIHLVIGVLVILQPKLCRVVSVLGIEQIISRVEWMN